MFPNVFKVGLTEVLLIFVGPSQLGFESSLLGLKKAGSSIRFVPLDVKRRRNPQPKLPQNAVFDISHGCFQRKRLHFFLCDHLISEY